MRQGFCSSNLIYRHSLLLSTVLPLFLRRWDTDMRSVGIVVEIVGCGGVGVSLFLLLITTGGLVRRCFTSVSGVVVIAQLWLDCDKLNCLGTCPCI